MKSNSVRETIIIYLKLPLTKYKEQTYQMKQLKLLNIAILLITSWLPLHLMAANLEFNYLTNREGLSNSQVNAIMQDNKGIIWVGTQSGLDRYDGFRFKNFFYKSLDESSIPNNSVDEIQQDAIGNLWIHTDVGYCIYQYDKERFDRTPEKWLRSKGIVGNLNRVFIEANKNMWFVMYGKGCYFLNTKTMKHRFFSFAEMGLKDAKEVHSFTEQTGTAVLSFKNGTICRIDGLRGKVLWTNPYLTKTYRLTEQGAFTFIDNRNNYWVFSGTNTFVYSTAHKKWYASMAEFMKAQGIGLSIDGKVLIRHIAKDKDNRIWIATDHDGFFILDYAHNTCTQYVKGDNTPGGIPDNSLKKIFIDKDGAVWIGTNKNGIAYYSPSSTKFSTIDLGDVCTITQDKLGNYWCGTNDAGIVCYNPLTGQRLNFGKAQTGLKSDIVVSSVTMSDGAMYFGTYNGGLACYRDGRWKTYFQAPHGLASQSIWALAEDKNHSLVIATLGGGMQFLDPKTETFTKTLDTKNSNLPSDYISSLSPMANGDILVGHSQNVTVINADTYKLTNYNMAKDGRPFPSPGVNHALCDSRGLFWTATPAGVIMYDPKSGQMEIVNDLNGTQGAVGCSVVEDKEHTIWLVSEFMVTHVKISKDDKSQWELNMISYNAMDGLQNRQFNYRAAFLSRNGDLVVGGRDGINIIHTQMEHNATRRQAKAMFSGVVLFEHPLAVGEKYEGEVVLDESLEACRELNLDYKANTFTVQLASSDVAVPSRNRFLYRMEGVTDKWMMTAVGRPEVTFTNLSPGSYVLQVKVVNGDGSVGEDVSELNIDVQPPFYLSIWAQMIYILIACGGVYLFRKRSLDHQKMLFEREKLEENIRKDKELNELKLRFFTSVSHELRTPLTLIISPLVSMIKKEDDADKKRKLELIHRNATKLLALVNQILDFRKIEQSHGKLNLSQIEIVSYIENICTSFQLLGNSKITLVFTSALEKIHASVDADKIGKLVNNLLSNAYKFTPDGGRVTVSLDVKREQEVNGNQKDVLRICVADTGMGISDEDKKHIFDRFYQANDTETKHFGGSGIGLNLVRSFAELHGGKVSVEDNPGGGAVFTVNIPLRQTTEAPALVETPVSSEKTSEGDKPVVLLVDDSDDFREFMRDVLSENYVVKEAANGKEAWEMLQQKKPDIILSDVMMPVMDGNQFCRLVKETPAVADVPFVMLTARLATEHRKEGFASGADDYLTKPFDIDLLNIRIKNLIAKAHRYSAHQAKMTANEPVMASKKETQEDIPGKKVVEDKEYVMTEGDKKFLNSIDIYIRDNMGDPETSVELMSAHLFISRVQLYKRMVSLTGTTPSEYLRAKRIHRAEELIHTGEYTISEIAYKVGFNNPRYFSKYFQEEYGMTPSQYKKQLLS